MEGIRFIKRALPDTRTILGISNVSFGLPAAAREVINSVFLYHCTKAGLDLAIVNAEKLERFASIPEKHRHLAEDLLFNHSAAPDAPSLGEALPPQTPPGADWRQQNPEQKVAINQAAIQ